MVIISKMMAVLPRTVRMVRVAMHGFILPPPPHYISYNGQFEFGHKSSSLARSMRVRARPLRGGIRNRCTVYADLILIIHNRTGSLSILKYFTF